MNFVSTLAAIHAAARAQYVVTWVRTATPVASPANQPARTTVVTADDESDARSQVYVRAGCPIEILSVKVVA